MLVLKASIRALVLAPLLAAAISASSAPAEAGGWGRGPSWKQAKKIVRQAGKDTSNGAKAATTPPGNEIILGGIVLGVCIATGGTCGIAF